MQSIEGKQPQVPKIPEPVAPAAPEVKKAGRVQQLSAKDTKAEQIDSVAQAAFEIPAAPGLMPESKTVNKIKADIQKLKEKIARGEAPESLEAEIVIKAKEFEERRQFDVFGNIIETQGSKGKKEVEKEKSRESKESPRTSSARKVAEVQAREQKVGGSKRAADSRSMLATSTPASTHSKKKEVEGEQKAEEKEIFEKTNRMRREAIERHDEKTSKHIEEAKEYRRKELSS